MGFLSLELIRLHFRFNIPVIRDVLELSPLDPDDVDPESSDFEALVEFKEILSEKRPVNEHHEALVLLRDNKSVKISNIILTARSRYNVQAACNLLGLSRSRTRPKKREQRIIFCPKYSRNQPECPVWPDHDNMVKADYDMQIQNHPAIIDLHYFTLQEARECVERYISYHKKLETREVFITTGRGINSASKKTIKNQTIKQLKSKKVEFKVNPINAGQLMVTFF